MPSLVLPSWHLAAMLSVSVCSLRRSGTASSMPRAAHLASNPCRPCVPPCSVRWRSCSWRRSAPPLRRAPRRRTAATLRRACGSRWSCLPARSVQRSRPAPAPHGPQSLGGEGWGRGRAPAPDVARRLHHAAWPGCMACLLRMLPPPWRTASLSQSCGATSVSPAPTPAAALQGISAVHPAQPARCRCHHS